MSTETQGLEALFTSIVNVPGGADALMAELMATVGDQAEKLQAAHEEIRRLQTELDRIRSLAAAIVNEGKP